VVKRYKYEGPKSPAKEYPIKEEILAVVFAKLKPKLITARTRDSKKLIKRHV
jgi:hypothetical protein